MNVNNKNFAYELPSFAEKMMIEIEEAKDKPSLLKKIKAVVNRFLLLFVSNAKKNKAKTTISNKITSLNGLNRYLKDNNENTLDLFSELKKGITLDQIGDYGLKLKQLIMLKTYPDLTKIEPHEAFGFQKRLFDHFMIDFHKKKEELGLSRARQNKLGGLETMFICCSINKKYLDKVMEITLNAHKAIGCRGATRSDFKFYNNKFYLLEINTQPGMTSLSLVPEIANYNKISFIQLIEWMIKDASINR